MEVRQAAISYIKSISDEEKKHLKEMLAHGVICGADYARISGVDPVLFTEELKSIFGGK